MEHAKKKELEILKVLSDLDTSDVKAAITHLQATRTMFGPEEPVEATALTISCPSVDLAIPSFTPLDFESSLDDMDDQLNNEELREDCPQLIFQALLSNISLSPDGGYFLTFSVGDSDKEEVSRLLKLRKQVLPIIVMCGTPSETPGEE